MMDEYSSGSSLLTWVRTSGIDVDANFMSLMRNSSQMMGMIFSRRFKKRIEAYPSRSYQINPTTTSGIDVVTTKNIDNLSVFQSHLNLIVAGGEV